MANKKYPKTLSFSTTIPFDQPLSYMPEHTITGALTFIKSASGAQVGFGAMVRLVADGSHTPDLSDFALEGPGTWVNTNGTVNKLVFYYDGSQFCVIITQPGTGGVASDVTPPTLSSASIVGASPNKVTLTFNEALDTSVLLTTGQFVVTVDGTDRTTSTVNISGSAVEVNFGGAAVTAGQTVVIDYIPGSNPIKDVAGNGAAGFTNQAVTNSVGSTTTLNAPTGLTLGTATSTTQPLTWTDTNTTPNESGYKVYRNTVNTFGTATLVTTTAADATSYTVTGLTASTTYYYWVIAAGNGTTTADSSAATASGSTAAAGYDADSTAYFTSESITDTATKDAIDALIVGLKTDGVWTSNVKGIFMGWGSGLTNARTNTAATGTNLPTISSGNFAFDGVNDAINTGITPSTDLSTTEAYFLKATSITGQSMIGSRESSAGTYIFFNSGGDIIFRLGSSSDATVAGQGGNGRYAIYRKGDSFTKVLKNGSSVYNSSLGVTTASTKPLAFGARNDDGAPFNPVGFSGGTVPILIIATNLDDTKAAAIDARIATYLTTLGL